MIETIKQAWAWTGLDPAEVVGENDFGNLIVKDVNDRYWRLCPEDVYCKVIAGSREELDTLSRDREFLRDWYMEPLVTQAEQKLGPLPEGKKYCLKIPGILGGEYGGENLGMISFKELIEFSGDLARKIKDLPDGSKIKFKFVD